jgi:DNA-binding transcriptional LysR family regulator
VDTDLTFKAAAREPHLCAPPPQNREAAVFDWNDLRYFLALARTGSMGAAARVLRVNQSTVQRRVNALEIQLGHVLVERRADGYQLTDQGRALFGPAERVDTAAADFRRAADALGTAPTGHIKVASLVTIGQRIVKSGFLDRFRAKHPGITVEMQMSQRLADIAQGEADIAIRGGGPGSEALVGRKLADLPWGIYASRAFVERYGRPETPQDLARFPLIELIDELEHVPAARWIESHVPAPKIAARCGNVPSVQLAIKSGAGLAALPTVHASEDQELICILGPIAEMSYPMYLYAHRDFRRIPRVSVFFDFCARELKTVLLTGALRPAEPRNGPEGGEEDIAAP